MSTPQADKEQRITAIDAMMKQRDQAWKDLDTALAALKECRRIFMTPYQKRNKPDGTSEGMALRSINAVLASLDKDKI
jgi:hypothetical protein